MLREAADILYPLHKYETVGRRHPLTQSQVCAGDVTGAERSLRESF
jgi:hypothetical protein